MANLMKSGSLFALLASAVMIAGCGGGSGSGSGSGSGGGGTTEQPAAAPTISTTTAQNGAEMVTLASTTSGATIYYTIDGTTPTASSIAYGAPFMVASNLTINAIATASGDTASSVTTKAFTPNIASGTLVWSDEFANTGSSNVQPNSAFWTYDTGAGGWGNSELENYCSYGSTASPCDTSKPNAFVAPGGGLNIVAEEPSAGVYTSARMKTEGLFSFQYGRLEARIKLPEGNGLWPAFWLLGSNINTDPWPACGELDVLEHIDGSNPQNEGFDWVQGSVHGTGLDGGIQYHPTGFSAADWHTYGMIWTKGQIEYYVDDPSNVYATYTSSSMAGTWPFDSGPQFILMNLAVGGGWPGSPDATTPFPSTMQVQYVRIYTN
jgi:beta-glucanase (GH16 family)